MKHRNKPSAAPDLFPQKYISLSSYLKYKLDKTVQASKPTNCDILHTINTF